MKLQKEVFPLFSITYLSRRGLHCTEDQAQVRGSGSHSVSSINIHTASSDILFQPVPLTGTKPTPVQAAPAPVALHVSLQDSPSPSVSSCLRAAVRQPSSPQAAADRPCPGSQAAPLHRPPARPGPRGGGRPGPESPTATLGWGLPRRRRPPGTGPP